MKSFLLFISAAVSCFPATADLERARDLQDRTALEKIAAELSTAAAKSPKDPEAQYQLALASSYLAEVALELRDKAQAQKAAELGIRAAERAVALKPDVAEYHRVLGTLYGQVIPANPLLGGLKYGKSAQHELNKAIELDPKLAEAYISRGVGNYYLPPSFGGGAEAAIRDFEKAIQLYPKSAEAYMWLGLAFRKLHRNAEARKALAKSLQLNPNRTWTKQQLEKTPAQ